MICPSWRGGQFGDELVALDAVLNVEGFGTVGPRRQEEAVRAGYDLACSGLALCLVEA